MVIWIISKYTTIPGFELLPSRWYYLSKYFNLNNCDVTIFIGTNNHLSKSKYSNNEITKDGVLFRIINSTKYKSSGSIKRVISWFHWEFNLFFHLLNISKKPDVVICSSLSILSIINGLILKLLYNTKVVFEVRDIWPLSLTAEGNFSKFNPFVIFLSIIEKIGYKYSDMIVGTMPGLKLHVGRIIKNKKVFISPLGFDFNPFELSQGKKNEIFTVGYFGSTSTTNALTQFIETISLAEKNRIEMNFLIVGSGDYLLKYKKILEHNNNVMFLEKVQHAEVFELMNSCELLFLSTHKSEIWDYGQSMNKVVDYMATGIPIVAIYSGLESMINEANCGEFIKHCSTKELLNVFIKYKNLSQNERKLIGINGKKWIHENRQYFNLSNEYLQELKKL